MNHKEALQNYIGLFEEYLDKAPELIEQDNFEDYKEAVDELNKLQLGEDTIWYCNLSVNRTIDEIKNLLPF